MLGRTVSNATPGGRLSTSSGWYYILEGLALLLLVFRVDTISRWDVSFICKGTVVPTDGVKLMMPFLTGTRLERVETVGPALESSLGRSAGSGCCAPLQKQVTKTIGRGSPVAALMPKSALSRRKNRLTV